MAIVYSYPLNDNIKITDELVGTTDKSINGQLKTVTRNFLLEDLASFFITGGGIQKTIELTTLGSSGAATLNQITGVLNIPIYNATLQDLQSVTNIGYITTDPLIADSFIKQGGTSSQFLMANGDVSTNVVRDVAATGPITSSGGATPIISTSMATNKLIGRSTSGVGVMEEITIGSGLTLSGGTLTNTATATPLGYYGAFQDNTIQTAIAINTPYAMRFGITDLSNAVTIISDGSYLTRITIANTGIYNIQFSAQFDRTNSGTDAVDIWLRKNGVDVPGSGGKIILTGGAAASAIIATWNYVLDVAAGDYYQLMWSTPDTRVRLLYEAAQTSPFTHPLIPSVILTVTQQSGIMAGTGITAINSLTSASQTLTVGTAGTDFAIVDSGNDHKFNLPSASETARGLVTTSAQTFAGTKILSTAPILSSLVASQILALDASKNIQSLDVATYPSLTELSYGKGVTGSIQAQLNSSVKVIVNEFPNTSSTGTTTETLLSTFIIPANSFQASCMPNIKMKLSKTTGNGNGTVRIYFSTVNNFATATQLGLFTTNNTVGQFPFVRNPVINDGLIRTTAVTQSIISDEAGTTTGDATFAFNNTVTNYIFISSQHASALDTTTLRSFKIIN